MDKFILILSPSAVRDLDNLDERVARIILNKSSALEENPFPRGKLIKKIKGKNSNYYRMRAGKYRVFYFIEANEVVILKAFSNMK